jgi:parallel beta-helix repeat protein
MRSTLFRRRAARQSTWSPRVEPLEMRNLPSGSTPTPIVVQPGELIQAAINSAPATGATILIQPGTYQEAITVTKPNIQLVGLPGKGGVVIAPPAGGADDGICVMGNGNNFVLTSVTVRDFSANGVMLIGVSNFRLSNVKAVDNDEYGLYPVQTQTGVMQFCVASGSHDSGIYVGQSSKVTIRYCAVTNNVNGIEVENSTDVTAKGNVAWANTVGIFVDLLPPLAELGITVATQKGNTITGNIVVANNRANNADPTDIASAEESGVGILVVGGTSTTVSLNFVAGNNVGGIVLLSGLDLETLGALPAGTYVSAGVDPTPENTSIQYNVVIHNGLHPTNANLPHADLIASQNALAPPDGHNPQDHWVGNVYLTSSPTLLTSQLSILSWLENLVKLL